MNTEIYNHLHKQPGTALVLSGGATKSLYFHLGVLKALQGEPISSIVGSSAGAVVGAFIASGLTVNDLITSVYQHEVYLPQLDKWVKSFTSNMLFRPNIYNLIKQGFHTSYETARFAMGLRWLKMHDPVAALIDTVIDSQTQTSNIFNAMALEALFRELLPSSSFHDTLIDLYITATDLDGNKRGIFNTRYDFKTEEDVFMSDVPIHRAVRASTAIPGMFEPVRIKGHTYVDGEIKRTLSADIGVAVADKVIISHTYQPLQLPEKQSVSEYGWWNVVKQSSYILFYQRIKIWQELYLDQHPDTEFIFIHPDPEDAQFFLAPQFSFRPEVQKQLIASGERAARKALAEANIPLPEREFAF